MKKKIRIAITWIIISLMLQFGFYAYLNSRVAGIMAPPTLTPIVVKLNATIPGINLKNIQVSYDKNFLAYIEHGSLKVFNLKSGKFIFEKKADSNSTENMGVLCFQWLPDRDSLIYLIAQKNPDTPKLRAVQNIRSDSSTNKVTALQEDPNVNNEKDTPPVPPEPVAPKEYNSQITDLYTLEFHNGDDEEPEDRKNITIDNFPAGGTVNQIVFSTQTNLIYLTVQTGSSMKLLEIDVMKNVRTLNKYNELIDSMVASDRYGTLYIESKLGKLKQIVALKGWDRKTISENENNTILGVHDGIVYMGEILHGKLVKIETFKDLADINEKISFDTFWKGSIPFDHAKVIFGLDSQLVVYDSRNAYFIKESNKVRKLSFDNGENYITSDGVELIKLTKDNEVTHVELKPLEQ